ncbi:CobW family GTP-binding protein [Alsobacter sp. SYSU BS001988]
MAREARIPVTVITGFLGAGKTTLLNRLLRDPALSDTVVIVNEFGEIGLDHLFVETGDEGMILLSSGCLCCTVRGDLVNTLEDLAAKRDDGRIAPFRRIAIETTGLADPAPILHALMSHPTLLSRYALDGVVTLVDAVNGLGALDAQPEAVKQAAVADRIVLTKTDLAAGRADADVAALRRRLARLNPGAPLLDAAAGEATAAAVMGSGPFDPSRKIPDVAGWLHEEAYRDGHAHAGHDHAHDPRDQDAHDVNRHDASIRAFSVTSSTPIPMAALDMFLTLLPSAHGAKLLRMKGVVDVAEHPGRPVVIHGVQHVVHPPVMLERWPDQDHRTRLVFITRDLDESFVRRMWDAFSGVVAVDTPDRAALMDNPLALSRGDA